MPRESSDPVVLLDACCLINLLATGRLEEILAVLPYRFATSRLVALQEVLSCPAGGLEALTLLDFVSAEEAADFVRFSVELDEGEASICAFAVQRKAIVATDDRKALRALSREVPRVPTLQTPELLYEWTQAAKPSRADILDALRAVQDRGRFFPRRDAPRFEWWDSFFR
jgi:hypothetical protein